MFDIVKVIWQHGNWWWNCFGGKKEHLWSKRNQKSTENEQTWNGSNTFFYPEKSSLRETFRLNKIAVLPSCRRKFRTKRSISVHFSFPDEIQLLCLNQSGSALKSELSMWKFQQILFFYMEEFTNEDSSHRYSLQTDSNLAALNRAAEYFGPCQVFTGT